MHEVSGIAAQSRCRTLQANSVLKYAAVAVVAAFALTCPLNLSIQAWMARIVLYVLNVLSDADVPFMLCGERQILGPSQVQYRFIGWWTPIVPWMCSLVFLARIQCFKPYAIGLFGSLAIVTALRVLDATVAILLAEQGVSWAYAHHPSNVTMYLIIVIGSVVYSFHCNCKNRDH